MRNPVRYAAFPIFFTLILILPLPAGAQHETVLHSFGGPNDGTNPTGGLVSDAFGNLYGNSLWGGPYGTGAVYKFSPRTGGGFTESLLHAFKYTGRRNPDGANPYATLMFDAVGNIYGTTYTGGYYGYGTVFELSPQPGGGWAEKVLHNFTPNGTDGLYPIAAVIMDSAGNLYGTAEVGGAYGHGVVFELSPSPGGGWQERILVSFDVTDGETAAAPLTFDAAGNLYSTTYIGGTYGDGGGTAFELSSAAHGMWAETVLQNFSGSTGSGLLSGVIFDSAGNLYGTTGFSGCCNGGGGSVFELSPAGSGTWTETTLYNFPYVDNGAGPVGLIFDGSGNLFGVNANGGANGLGSVFELTPGTGGTWTESTVYSFAGGSDGAIPDGQLVLDSSGNIYGTTNKGGAFDVGTLFEIRP